jgi:PAS domain S-box-containing protein
MGNEESVCVMSEKAPAMLWMAGTDRLRIHFNKRWLDFTGRPVQSELQNGWTEGVHPDDLPRLLDIYSGSFDRRQEFKMEYRLRRHDGEYRWVCDNGAPWFEADDSFAGYIGSCFDIHESKLAAEALARIVGRLLDEQEQERMRIAGELHDDIGSSLAIIGIEVFGTGQPASGSSRRKNPDNQELYQKVQEIGSRVSRLSNQLRPAMLKYFGLAKAIGIECRDFSEACQIPVSCSCNNLPSKMDPAIALICLRVVQEALRNVGKHSRATSATVDVSATSTEIILAVSDDGAGFNVEQTKFGIGLGLISMRERMWLIGGTFEIRSQSGQGTKILCRAPLVESGSDTDLSGATRI